MQNVRLIPRLSGQSLGMRLGESHYLNHFASQPVDYPLSSSSSEEEEEEVSGDEKEEDEKQEEVSDSEEGEEEEKEETKNVSDNEKVEKEVSGKEGKSHNKLTSEFGLGSPCPVLVLVYFC